MHFYLLNYVDMSKDHFYNKIISLLSQLLVKELSLPTTDFSDLIVEDDETQTILNGIASSATDIDDKLTGSQRPIEVVESLVNGSTDSGVQSVSILFRGGNGTLNGVSVIDNSVFSFEPNKGEDTIGSISYTVPNTGESRVIISYVR